MRSHWLLAMVTTLVGLAAAGCPGGPDRTPYPTVTATPVPAVCDPADASPETEHPYFTLDLPDNAVAPSPFHLTGESILNESLFRARIIDRSGTVLNEVPLWIVSTTERYLDYDAVIGFDVAEPTPVCLQVYLLKRPGDPDVAYLRQRNVLVLPGADTGGGACPLNEVPPDGSRPAVTVESPGDQLRSKPEDLPRAAGFLQVSGRVDDPAMTITLRLVGPGGAELGATEVRTGGAGTAAGTYSVPIPFSIERPTAACLQVFSRRPGDGGMENLVQREALLVP